MFENIHNILPIASDQKTDPELDWVQYRQKRAIAEAMLSLAVTLDEKLDASCAVMEADMLGLRAMAALNSRDRELGYIRFSI